MKFLINASAYVVKAKQLLSTQGLVESWKAFQNARKCVHGKWILQL